MRAVVVSEPEQMKFDNVPEPTYGDYEALVEIMTCSICSGTDTHIVDGQFPMRLYPCILGHESIGRVVECGSRVQNFSPGDLVLRPVAIRPGETLGGYQSMFGGFAEYGIVADAAALTVDTPRDQPAKLPTFAAAQQKVPTDFDPNLAGAFITFKETLNFLYRLGLKPGHSLLILGSGTVGLSFTMAAKLIGAHPVIVTGRRAEPLNQALEFGADAVINVTGEDLQQAIKNYTNGQGIEFAVEAVGDWNVLQEGVRTLADNGQMGVYGVDATRTATLDWSGTPPTWSLRFVQPREEAVHQQILDQMKLGIVNLAPLASHIVPFEQIQLGFELVRQKKATKVVIQIRPT